MGSLSLLSQGGFLRHTSLATKEMQIKMTLRFHLTPFKVAIIPELKPHDVTSSWQDVLINWHIAPLTSVICWYLL
jgi:hypothetical protein